MWRSRPNVSFHACEKALWWSLFATSPLARRMVPSMSQLTHVSPGGPGGEGAAEGGVEVEVAAAVVAAVAARAASPPSAGIARDTVVGLLSISPFGDVNAIR